jgi:transcription initiation factor TFIIIB Brf1 subunit/transcription initiation factor TFIIB
MQNFAYAPLERSNPQSYILEYEDRSRTSISIEKKTENMSHIYSYSPSVEKPSDGRISENSPKLLNYNNSINISPLSAPSLSPGYISNMERLNLSYSSDSIGSANSTNLSQSCPVNSFMDIPVKKYTKVVFKKREEIIPKKELDACKHEDVDSSYFCLNCRMQLLYTGELKNNNSGQSYTARKKSQKSILKDMENLKYTDNVKNTADSIYKSMNQGTRRSRRRLQLIYSCIYKAHVALGITVDPKVIADDVGISQSSIISASSMYSEAQTGYSSCSKFTPASEYLPSYIRQFNLSDDLIDGAVEMCDQIVAKNSVLKEKSPATTAAGFLKYFLNINGIVVPSKDFTKVTHLSDATVNSVCKIVEATDNS